MADLLDHLQITPQVPRARLVDRGQTVPISREQEQVIVKAIGRERHARLSRLVSQLERRTAAPTDDRLRRGVQNILSETTETVTLGGDALRSDVIMEVTDGVLRELSPDARADEIQRSRIELKHTRKAIENLARAVAEGGELQSLLAELRTRESRREELTAILAAHDRAVVQLDRDAIEAQVRRCVASCRALLTNHIQDGRQLLREVLVEPLFFTPEDGTFRFEGDWRWNNLSVGLCLLHPLWRPNGNRER